MAGWRFGGLGRGLSGVFLVRLLWFCGCLFCRWWGIRMVRIVSRLYLLVDCVDRCRFLFAAVLLPGLRLASSFGGRGTCGVGVWPFGLHSCTAAMLRLFGDVAVVRPCALGHLLAQGTRASTLLLTLVPCWVVLVGGFGRDRRGRAAESPTRTPRGRGGVAPGATSPPVHSVA